MISSLIFVQQNLELEQISPEKTFLFIRFFRSHAIFSIISRIRLFSVSSMYEQNRGGSQLILIRPPFGA